MGEVGAWVLWNWSTMYQDNLLGYLSLEMEMGSFLIPASDSGRDGVHSLDALHNPNWDSS